MLACFCTMLVLPGCALLNTNTLYDASAPPIPLHQKQGEFKAAAGYGGYLGANGYFSYALTENFAIQGAGHYNHQLWQSMELGIFSAKSFQLNNHALEGSFGFFLPVESGIFNVFELYGGGGFGQINKRIQFSSFNLRTDYHGPKGNYSKGFVQVNLGRVKERKEFGFSTRLTMNRYPNLRYYDVSNSEQKVEVLDNTTAFFLEPVFYYGVGKGKAKFSSQLGFAAPLPASTNGEANHYRRGSIILSLGLKLNLGNS